MKLIEYRAHRTNIVRSLKGLEDVIERVSLLILLLLEFLCEACPWPLPCVFPVHLFLLDLYPEGRAMRCRYPTTKQYFYLFRTAESSF